MQRGACRDEFSLLPHRYTARVRYTCMAGLEA